MSVFLAASDESGTTSHDGNTVYGGFVAPTADWNDWFIPAWEEAVLQKAPPIDCFHVVDLRSGQWRAAVGKGKGNGMTKMQSEAKFDEASRIIRTSGFLSPIISDLSNEAFHKVFDGQRFRHLDNEYRLKPEYIAFKGWVYSALLFVARQCPEATKVDFIFEAGDPEVNLIYQVFFEDVAAELVAMNQPVAAHAAKLKGSIDFRAKDFVPLQAADFLVWHSRRLAKEVSLTDREYGRFAAAVMHKGSRYEWSDAQLRNVKEVMDASARAAR